MFTSRLLNFVILFVIVPLKFVQFAWQAATRRNDEEEKNDDED